ncbi:MAG: hypothetical protein ABI760_05300 [Ferruginibacter sp.]
MTILNNYAAMLMKTFAAVMIFATLFASCKKDDVDPPPAKVTVEGLYAGKYGFDNEVPDNDQKYKIKAGGIFQEISIHNGSVVGQGTWLLNGNTLTATYTMVFSPYNKYSISASFNAVTNKLTGTWGSDNNATDGGKIDMTKQ